MSRAGEQEEEEDDNGNFHDSLDRLLSSTNSSCTTSDSDDDPLPKFPLPVSHNYDVWTSQPSSVEERRLRLLRYMGLISSHHLNYPSGQKSNYTTSTHNDSSEIVYNDNSGHVGSDDNGSSSLTIVGSKLKVDSNESVTSSIDTNADGGNECNIESHESLVSSTTVSTHKPPIAKSRVDCMRNASFCESDGLECNGDDDVNAVCVIKNLDNGKEFLVNEVREDGMWEKIKEVGTGRQLTMEEFSFEMCVGTSPIVQELMRRQNIEDGNDERLDSNGDANSVNGSKLKKRGSWLKRIRKVASSVRGHKDIHSSDERDTSSEKGGTRSSSATDDSQDSFHGPERVRVRQYGKSVKDLTAMYKSQEIQAHNGSIWTVKFSLDGKYLASAGEDCVIHVWQVVETEKKGDLFFDKLEDGNFNLLFPVNGSPEPFSVSPKLDGGYLEKKRRSRSSISRKSVSLDYVLVPESVFALSEKPVCSFQGHLDDVLDLSWSKSQQLLSSSMDKTVRLWDLSSEACLKIFSHSDYVTCIQFNPVDDRYFISGSLDGKVRIWSIPDHQVVDWNDLHEMVTAACYTPDGQGALVGSYKGSCRVYKTSDNKLQQKGQINLQNKKKKSHQKKITGFQFAPGSTSEVLVTSADSRIRVIDGADLAHKFKGFRNTNSQISASLTSNGKHVVAASEDSFVYIWRHEVESRPNRSKGVTVTQSYEFFHCQDVSMAIPWPGLSDYCALQHTFSRVQNGAINDVSTANHPTSPAEETTNGIESPLNGTLSSATNSYLFDRISGTWPEEKMIKNRSPRVSVDFSNGLYQNRSAWGMVIVTAGLRGEIRTFQNFGLPSA